MNAQALLTLSRAADNVAEAWEAKSTGGQGRAAAQEMRIAAQDARREAQAASGYSTEATLMWSICVNNNNDCDVAEIVAKHAGSETARADLADALKDWTKNAAGVEGVEGDGMTIKGSEGAGWSLSLLMLTLIQSAIVAIDWHALAVILLAEHAGEDDTAPIQRPDESWDSYMGRLRDHGEEG